MFEDVRRAFRDLLHGTPPSGDARRSIIAQMRETLVQARMGLDDLRKGVEETRARLTRERSELETVRRRKQLADGIKDAQTVAIAERYEKQHAERAALLERLGREQEAGGDGRARGGRDERRIQARRVGADAGVLRVGEPVVVHRNHGRRC